MLAKPGACSNGAAKLATEAPQVPVVETSAEAVPAAAATLHSDVAVADLKRLRNGEAIPIEPRDAREWWRSAARRWRTVFEPEVNGAAMTLCSTSQTCSLCCTDTPPWYAVRLACEHGWYCQQCILRHAEGRLEKGAFEITCPECEAMGVGVPLPERDLRRLLPVHLVEKLLQRSLERAVLSCPDLFFCPTPNCACPVALEDGDTPHFVCPKCDKSCCLRCRAQPWHSGMSCLKFAQRAKSKEADESFAQWMRETRTKQCPTCGCAVSKDNLEKQSTQEEECDKMICRNCHTMFCFQCLTNLAETLCSCTPLEHLFVDPHSRKLRAHHAPQAHREARNDARRRSRTRSKRPNVSSRRAGA